MMQINLRQLEYFAAAAHHGGAARAAQALGVSQPSVSKAIADLEVLWGEALFVRLHARGMELTAAGVARHRAAQRRPALPFNLALLKGASIVGVFWGDFVRREPKAFAADMRCSSTKTTPKP